MGIIPKLGLWKKKKRIIIKKVFLSIFVNYCKSFFIAYNSMYFQFCSFWVTTKWNLKILFVFLYVKKQNAKKQKNPISIGKLFTFFVFTFPSKVWLPWNIQHANHVLLSQSFKQCIYKIISGNIGHTPFLSSTPSPWNPHQAASPVPTLSPNPTSIKKDGLKPCVNPSSNPMMKKYLKFPFVSSLSLKYSLPPTLNPTSHRKLR